MKKLCVFLLPALLLAAGNLALAGTDDPVLGTVDTVGGTTYDWQANGPALRMLANSDGYGIHARYVHVPTTSNDDVVREHRFDASVSIGRMHLGARCTLLLVRNPDSTSTQVEGGAFGAWAF